MPRGYQTFAQALFKRVVCVVFEFHQKWWEQEASLQSLSNCVGFKSPRAWRCGNSSTHVVEGWIHPLRQLDAEGDPGEAGPNPQEDGEAPDHLLEELDNFGGGFGRSERVGAVPGQNLCCSCTRETLQEEVTRLQWHHTQIFTPARNKTPMLLLPSRLFVSPTNCNSDFQTSWFQSGCY